MAILFVYVSSEKNRMPACRFDEHRDNSRNLQSVFLIVVSVSRIGPTDHFDSNKKEAGYA